MVIGIVCRLALIPLTSWAKDDSIWMVASANGLQHLNLYQRIGFSYPPVWGYVLEGLGWSLQHLGLGPGVLGTRNLGLQPLTSTNEFSTMVTSVTFNVLFKGILLLADLGTGLLIYDVSLRALGDQRRARLAFCLWFLNPFVLFESAVFGAFDVLIAFTVLSAACLFLSGRRAWAGMALAIAVMAKGAPVFVAPFFIFAALRAGDSTRSRLRAGVTFAVGLAAGAVALTIPLLATGEVHASISAVFARTNGPKYGGLSILGLARFAGLSSLLHPVVGSVQLGHVVLALQALASIVLGAVGARLASRGQAFATYSTVAVVLATVVVLGPAANPQYVLWFLPELVVLTVVWRRQFAPMVIFSALPLVFVLTIFGPAELLFPMAEHGFVTVPALTTALRSWSVIPRAFWSTAGGATNFAGPAGVLAVLGIALVYRDALRSRPRRAGRAAELTTVLAGAGTALATGVLLVVSVAGALVVAATPGSSAVDLRIQRSAHAIAVAVAVKPGPTLDQLRLAALPVPSAAVPRRVAIYVDPAYPVSGSTAAAVSSIASALTNALRLRGFRGTVREVNAEGLRAVLQNGKAARVTAVVDTSGVLPHPVFGPHRDLVGPWLRAGGTLYWGGEAIGATYGVPAHGDHLPKARRLGHGGIKRFFPPNLLGHLDVHWSAGSEPSEVARAIGLSYVLNGHGLRVAGPDVPPAARAGGPGAATFPGAIGPANLTPGELTPLGWIGHGLASIAAVPEGFGHLVVLGGSVDDERDVSPDLALLILSGAAQVSGPIRFTDVAAAVVHHGGVAYWSVRPATPGPTTVMAFDPSPTGLVFGRRAPGMAKVTGKSR